MNHDEPTQLRGRPASRARTRFDALEDADLPWVNRPGSVAFAGQGGRLSGIASDPETAHRIVASVNAHGMLLAALLDLKVAAEHRAEHGCYPAGMGAHGLTFEAWVASVVDATVDAVALQSASLQAQDDATPPIDLPRAA